MTRSLLIIPFVLIIIFYPGLSTTFSQLSFCCLLLERASRKWRWFSCERRPCRVNGRRRFTREMCRRVGEMPTRRQTKRRCRVVLTVLLPPWHVVTSVGGVALPTDAPPGRSDRIPVVFFTPSLRPFVKNDWDILRKLFCLLFEFN